MILIWKPENIPTLKEADEKIKDAALRGFKAVAVDMGEIEHSELMLEALKGCCRSGYKHGADIYLCISSYRAVASVPSLRAQVSRNGEICRSETALDPLNSMSAHYLWEVLLKPAAIRLKAFAGKEFKGFVLKSPYRDCGEGEIPVCNGETVSVEEAEKRCGGFYEAARGHCREKVLELLSFSELATVETDGESYNSRMSRLIEELVKGKKLPCAAVGEAFPCPAELDAKWVRAADRLAELIEKATAVEARENVHIFHSGDGLIIYAATALETEEITLPEGYMVSAEDISNGALYDFPGGKIDFAPGGVLTVHLSKEPVVNSAATPFPGFGVQLENQTAASLPALITSAGDNILPVENEFNAEYIPDEIYFEAKEQKATINGSAVVMEKMTSGYRGNVAGILRLGLNTVTSSGMLTGDFSTDGKSVVLPAEVSLGDVTAMGMPFYGGELCYQAKLPDILTEEKSLILEGSFMGAVVKIGRRRELAVGSPCHIPVYENDAGRIAEINIYGRPKNINEKENKYSEYGLYNVGIL